MKKVLLIGGVLTIVTIISIASYKWIKLQSSLLQDFCYKIVKFKFTKFTKDAILFGFSVELRNQSNIEVTIREVSTDVYIDKYLITTIKNSKVETLKKNDISTLDFDVNIQKDVIKIPLATLINLALLYITDQSKLNLTFDGYTKISVFGINIPMSIPFRIETNLKELMTESPSTCKI